MLQKLKILFGLSRAEPKEPDFSELLTQFYNQAFKVQNDPVNNDLWFDSLLDNHVTMYNLDSLNSITITEYKTFSNN